MSSFNNLKRRKRLMNIVRQAQRDLLARFEGESVKRSVTVEAGVRDIAQKLRQELRL